MGCTMGCAAVLSEFIQGIIDVLHAACGATEHKSHSLPLPKDMSYTLQVCQHASAPCPVELHLEWPQSTAPCMHIHVGSIVQSRVEACTHTMHGHGKANATLTSIMKSMQRPHSPEGHKCTVMENSLRSFSISHVIETEHKLLHTTANSKQSPAARTV